MGFEKDIREIFQEILNQHGGNKAAAAAFLRPAPNGVFCCLYLPSFLFWQKIFY